MDEVSCTIDKKLDAILERIESLRHILTQLLEVPPPAKPGSHGSVETFGYFGTMDGPTTSPHVKSALLPTLLAIDTLQNRRDRPTAEAVSRITERQRNTESANLAKLAELGWCTRLRIGREVIYQRTSEHHDEAI